MNVEGTPLYAGGVEAVVGHMQVTGTHCLRTQSVEQRHLCARHYTH
jgi:hypothetical protein